MAATPLTPNNAIIVPFSTPEEVPQLPILPTMANTEGVHEKLRAFQAAVLPVFFTKEMKSGTETESEMFTGVVPVKNCTEMVFAAYNDFISDNGLDNVVFVTEASGEKNLSTERIVTIKCLGPFWPVAVTITNIGSGHIPNDNLFIGTIKNNRVSQDGTGRCPNMHWKPEVASLVPNLEHNDKKFTLNKGNNANKDFVRIGTLHPTQNSAGDQLKSTSNIMTFVCVWPIEASEYYQGKKYEGDDDESDNDNVAKAAK